MLHTSIASSLIFLIAFVGCFADMDCPRKLLIPKGSLLYSIGKCLPSLPNIMLRQNKGQNGMKASNLNMWNTALFKKEHWDLQYETFIFCSALTNKSILPTVQRLEKNKKVSCKIATLLSTAPHLNIVQELGYLISKTGKKFGNFPVRLKSHNPPKITNIISVQLP